MKVMKTCLSFLPIYKSRKSVCYTTSASLQTSFHQFGSFSSLSSSHAAQETLSYKQHQQQDEQRQRQTQHIYLDPNNAILEELSSKPDSLPTSKPGLDPSTNRFHQPIVYHPQYSFDSWPTKHTFPMSKFYHTAQALLTKQQHLPRPLVRNQNDFFIPLNAQSIPEIWISKPNGPIDAKFLYNFLNGELSQEEKRIIGFRELCTLPELITRTLLEVSGTILTSNLAFRYGLATNVAGGTHHAHSTMGRGYTILNDLAITSKYVMDERLNGGTIQNINTVLVIDCDVHQGDGTAEFNLFEEDGGGGDKKEMVTLSLHCESNYPFKKAKSTYDISLPDNMQDKEYLQVLEESVNHAIDETKPDFVLYDAGVDIYEHDVLGRLDITEDGIRKRDRFVIQRCVQLGIPVVGVIGGGYDKDVRALGRRHAILHEEASFVWRKFNMWKR